VGILVCQRCDVTVAFVEDVKVGTYYTVCCTCEETDEDMRDDD